MGVADSIIAAASGLVGTGVGAFATWRITASSSRQEQVAAAHADLAAIGELTWMNSTGRQTRVAMLRYRLSRLGVEEQKITTLTAAIELVQKERRDVEWAVDNGDISPDEAGIATKLIDAVQAEADAIALSLR